LPLPCGSRQSHAQRDEFMPDGDIP
jgi:hypothetical protein